MKRQSITSGTLVSFSMVFCFASHAADSAGGYLTNSSGNVVRNSFGECWRTLSASPPNAEKCHADAVAARVEPPPEPAPAATNEPVNPPAAEPTPIAPATTVAAPPSDLPPDVKPYVETVSITANALFAFDEVEIKPAARHQLANIAGKLKTQREVDEVVITGHTDAIGSDAYNRELSEKRAQRVRDFLLSEGIVSKRIVIQALGEEKPIASNDTPEGRAKNRRVEISVQATAPAK